MTAVDILKVLHQHGEEVRTENFSRIFDQKSIAYLYKVLELEYGYAELSRVKESTLAQSSAASALRSAAAGEVREKDPERKAITSRIKSLVSGSIASQHNKEIQESVLRVPKREDDDDFDAFELERDFNLSDHEPETSARQIEEDFLDEQHLGLTVDKAAQHQEFSMPDASQREPSAATGGLQRRLFDISARLNDLKLAELQRLQAKYSAAPLTLTLLADFMVLVSCLIGKAAAQQTIEQWVHRRTGDAFNQAAEQKALKKKANASDARPGFRADIEEQVEEMKRMVREFFIKLD